jgi:hypothetical protein
MMAIETKPIVKERRTGFDASSHTIQRKRILTDTRTLSKIVDRVYRQTKVERCASPEY